MLNKSNSMVSMRIGGGGGVAGGIRNNKTMTNINIMKGSSPRENKYMRVRYNGNAFGGFQMTDSLFPRKSNLSDRK